MNALHDLYQYTDATEEREWACRVNGKLSPTDYYRENGLKKIKKRYSKTHDSFIVYKNWNAL